MITPFPPPPARVELLRVRRTDRATLVERDDGAPQRDPAEQTSLHALPQVERDTLNDEALMLLTRDAAHDPVPATTTRS